MARMDTDALHQALMQPDTYPEAIGPIRYRETHVSRLYFTAHQVFKIKKPVDFGFLDFTTLDRRRFYCEEEVRLNRRFCPDTYLGVVTIRRDGGRIRIGDEGTVLEYAVQMKRLPEERMLDRLISEDAPGLKEEMDRLAARLAVLHRESEICRSSDGAAGLKTVRENWEENFRQSAPFVGRTLEEDTVSACRSYVDGYLQRYSGLLRDREAGGMVRDGHGDLHAEHICLTDPIRIYDCIEFNRRFRVADIAADLAFLLMDLDFRNRRDLSKRLLRVYGAEMNGTEELHRLLPFYKIYRAWVRGKVESFLSVSETAGPDVREAATVRARQYFGLALGYLCPPALILTCGLMGTGKSTLAKRLAALLDAELLRSDVLRREIAGLGATDRTDAGFGKGAYSEAVNRDTYRLLLQRSLTLLAGERPVIADASFIRREDRDRFRRAAEAAGVSVTILYADCDKELALERLAQRRADGGDPSEGRPELYERQQAVFEIPVADEPVIRVDTAREVDYNALHVLTALSETTGMPT